jgi:type VI secretion system secreted protein VgrG
MTHDYKYATLKVGFVLAILLSRPSVGFAQTGLGSAESFSVLAGSAITNAGVTRVRGNMGVSPGTLVTGLPMGQPTLGTIHAGDAGAAQAQVDLAAAYHRLAGLPCTSSMCGENLGGKTLRPGTYCFSSSADLTGNLSLDARGDSSAVFVFQIGNALTAASCASVRLCNGAQPSHVWWLVGDSVILGVASTMQGNLLAHSSIALTSGASVVGRALALGGAVTMNANAIVGIGGVVTATARTSWTRLKAEYR